MKYVLVVGDGMADYPVPELSNKTPLQVASKPNMDLIAAKDEVGSSRQFLKVSARVQTLQFSRCWVTTLSVSAWAGVLWKLRLEA
jgi:hypothetical protein